MNSINVVALVSKPGGGKGYQLQRIIKASGLNSGIEVMSMSSVLRDMFSQNPNVANQMATGALVDNRLVADCFHARMNKYREDGVRTVFLDGFPRTCEQVYLLRDYVVTHKPFSTVHVLDFMVPDHICERRLRERFKKTGRTDDAPDRACGRLGLYYAHYYGLKIGDTIVQAMRPELESFGSYHQIVWNGEFDDPIAGKRFNDTVDDILIKCGAVSVEHLFEVPK